MNKIVRAARAALADGYKFMTAQIITDNGITYNVLDITKIIEKGMWISATAEGTQSVPAESISKYDAIKKYCYQQEGTKQCHTLT